MVFVKRMWSKVANSAYLDEHLMYHSAWFGVRKEGTMVLFDIVAYMSSTHIEESRGRRKGKRNVSLTFSSYVVN